jgi:hypothetical protein
MVKTCSGSVVYFIIGLADKYSLIVIKISWNSFMSKKMIGAINKIDNKAKPNLLSFVKPKLLLFTICFFRFLVKKKVVTIIEKTNTSIKIGGKG